VMSPRARNGAKRRGSFEVTFDVTVDDVSMSAVSARTRLRGRGAVISLSGRCVAIATIIRSFYLATNVGISGPSAFSRT
jgi:hypothetical protein